MAVGTREQDTSGTRGHVTCFTVNIGRWAVTLLWYLKVGTSMNMHNNHPRASISHCPCYLLYIAVHTRPGPSGNITQEHSTIHPASIRRRPPRQG